MERKLDEAYIRTFLEENKLATICTVTKDNKPHASAMYYTMDENWNFRFITQTTTHKSANVDSNEDVVISISRDET